MEKQRRIKSLAIIMLVVSVLGLTVVYASLSNFLTINGTAKANKARFNVRFDEERIIKTEGLAYDGSISLSDNDKTLNLDVTLKQPRDVIVYGAKIVNDSDYDVKAVDISYEMTSPNATNSDLEKAKNIITIKTYYVDDNGNMTEKNFLNEVIKADESKRIAIKVEYSDANVFTNSDLLPAMTLSVNYEITYEIYEEDSGGGEVPVITPEHVAGTYYYFANMNKRENNIGILTLNSDGTLTDTANSFTTDFNTYQTAQSVSWSEEDGVVTITCDTFTHTLHYYEINGVKFLDPNTDNSNWKSDGTYMILYSEDVLDRTIDGTYINGNNTLSFNSSDGIFYDSSKDNSTTYYYYNYANRIWAAGENSMYYDSEKDEITYNGLKYTKSN